MIYKLFSNIRDKYFNIKTRVSYPTLFKRFPVIKNGEVKLEYASDAYIAGFSMFDNYELFCHNRVVKHPVLTINSSLYKLNKDETEPVIAHELGHYSFFQNISPEKLRRRALWAMAYEFNFNKPKFLHCLDDVTDPASIRYLLRYMEDGKRIARLEKLKFMKEIYADNKAVESGCGNGLLVFLKKIYEKNDTLFDNELLHERIKNLESKLS